MAAGAWESGGVPGSEEAGSTPQTVWNMTGLVNGLPPVASAPGGLAVNELTGLKQNRMVGLAGEGAGTATAPGADVSVGGWGSVSASVGKDSTWDRPDVDPNLDIGTKAWESHRPGVTSVVWGQPQDKPPVQWGDIDIRQKNGLIIRETGDSPWDVRPKSWADIPPESPSSQNGSASVPSSSAASSQLPIGTSATASTAAESTSTTPHMSVSETSESDTSAATASHALSRDEIIAKAINSNEPWGRTPIRQDIPWVIDEEPAVRDPLPSLPPKLPAIDPADAQISRIGTGAWEQLRGGSGGAAAGWMGPTRNREDSGSWSITSPPADNLGPPGVGREFAGGVVGMSAFRPPVERPSSSTGGILASFPADRPPTGWGANPESGGNLWKDERKDPSGGFTGAAQQPLRRNLSTGNWPGDDPGGWNSAGGASAEVEDLINQGRQNWRQVSRPPTAQAVGQAGFRGRPDERGDASVFGVPPPSLQPGFRPGSRAGSQEDIGAAGQWGSLPVKLPNVSAGSGGGGGWGDATAAQWPPSGIDATRLKAPPAAGWNDDWNSRKQPQTRNRILQQLMDVGFRKEEAQAALINNNMDLRSAIADLVTSHNSLDPAAARAATTAPVDARFPPGAAAAPNAARQQQQVLEQQLQQQQRLLSSLGGILSSGLPINATQLQLTNFQGETNHSPVSEKLMQQQQQQPAPDAHSRMPVSPESVHAALQQQQMALLQSAHTAVQANLIPPHLIAAVPSLNPMGASKLQRLVQLFDVHQKLGSQAQLQVPGYPASADFNAVIKQQIVQLRQEVVLALTSSISSIPPPPLAGQAPTALPADMIRAAGSVQTAEDLAAASRLSQWKQPTDSKSPSANGPVPSTAAWPAPSALSLSGEKPIEGLAAEGGVASSPSLEIEEFVPGKPWQGPSMRSVEDDPYITPGSVTRSAISAIDDSHVMNVLGSKGPMSAAIVRQTSGMWSGEVDARTAAQNPGAHIARSISWAPGDRTNAPMYSAVGAPSQSLRIRNLPAQIDHALLKALLERFGSLRYFFPSPSGDQILVSYAHVEDAAQAQHAMTAGAPGGLPPLVVEFINDVDLLRSRDQPAMAPGGYAESGWGLGLGGAFGGSSGASVWSSGEDHSSFLPSDLFSGGQ